MTQIPKFSLCTATSVVVSVWHRSILTSLPLLVKAKHFPRLPPTIWTRPSMNLKAMKKPVIRSLKNGQTKRSQQSLWQVTTQRTTQ